MSWFGPVYLSLPSKLAFATAFCFGRVDWTLWPYRTSLGTSLDTEVSPCQGPGKDADRVAHIISFLRASGLDLNVSKVMFSQLKTAALSPYPPTPLLCHCLGLWPLVCLMSFVFTCQLHLPQELCVLRLQREANAVALAPDGRRAAVGLQAQRHRRSPSCRRQQTIYIFIYIYKYIYIYKIYIYTCVNPWYGPETLRLCSISLRNRGTFNVLILSTGWHGPRSSKHIAFRQLALHSCRICSLFDIGGL